LERREPDFQIERYIDIDPRQSQRTVVLFLTESCGFCADGLPFYGRIVSARRDVGEVQVVVAAPDEDQTIAAYLASGDVYPDRIVHFKRGSIGRIHTAPTLLLTNSAGDLMAAWEGALTTAQEEDVWQQVFGGRGDRADRLANGAEKSR
jgi:hypothetical protein